MLGKLCRRVTHEMMRREPMQFVRELNTWLRCIKENQTKITDLEARIKELEENQ